MNVPSTAPSLRVALYTSSHTFSLSSSATPSSEDVSEEARYAHAAPILPLV